MSKLFHSFSCIVLTGLLCLCAPRASGQDSRPNVILIMTDNHGAWTLGCYGNPDIRTPNIDRLASEGTLFTRAFASNPVCSPTRATFLTGLMPSQHGVHCFLVGGRLQTGPDAQCTLNGIRSLPEILKDNGYSCGLVGKWHLGGNLEPQEGFDDYWITMPHGGTSTFYGASIIEDGKIRTEPQYLTDFWTKHAVNYIEQEAKTDRPFFLFLAYNGPYSLSRLLLRDGQNRHADYYSDKSLPSFPRQPTHPWQYSNRDYHNNETSIRRVATEVSGIDDGVGSIMETLKQNGLEKETIVIFVADQGWVGGQGGFFGMGDHTRPVTAKDGMMQIPMIWKHPDHIRKGAKSNRLVANYDLLPTLLSHLKIQDESPTRTPIPGRDFSSELQIASSSANSRVPSKAAESNQAIFYEFESLRCIRTESWKYIHRFPNGPHELFDLQNDPEEFDNLANSEAFGSKRIELKKRLQNFFEKHADSEFDLWKGGRSKSRIFVGIDEEIAQTERAAPPELPKGFAPVELKLPQGFSAELVAGPPLVTHPTMGCFDDQGRLFVCNNAGVNMSAEQLEDELPNSIRLLEDTDSDGYFDKATVFADNMTYPMGAAWHEGSLFVASPPNIWKLTDTSGDGVADLREVIVGKFGYTGNAASIHGCFLGPDGRLYWCDGYHGHEFKDPDGNITSQRRGSYLFSCKRDGSDVRIHCGGGMDNPVEIDFTKQGDLIGSVNILYTRPRVDALVHWLYGGVYPHRERVLEEVKTTGDLLGPVHRFGHVAVSGVTRYRSGTLDHRWDGNFFATFFNLGKVVRLGLSPQGSTYEVTQREFLSSPDRDFHPTDVIEDSDGSLLVIDTGGWFYRGCPTSQMAKPEVLGGIYRIRRNDMTSLPDPWGKQIRWEAVSNPELVKRLNDTRHAVRNSALAECERRGEEIVPLLAKANKSDIRVRRNAIWALTRIIGSNPDLESAKSARRAFTRDALARIRQVACRSIATYPDKLDRESLIQCLRDDSAGVRREAAKALGRIGDSDSVPLLLSALSAHSSVDDSERHAIVYALLEIADTDQLAQALDHSSPVVQRAALIVLDQLSHYTVRVEKIAALLSTDDELLLKTASEILAKQYHSGIDVAEKERVPVIDATEKCLASLLERNDRTPEQSEVISNLIKTFAGDQRIANRIAIGLSDQRPEQDQEFVLRSLVGNVKLSTHRGLLRRVVELLDSPNPSIVRSSIDVLALQNSDSSDKALRRFAEDDGRPALPRVAAIRALSRTKSALSRDAFDILVEVLVSSDPKQANESAQLLASSALSSEQRASLVPSLSVVGPSTLRELLRCFQRTMSPELATKFLSAIEHTPAIEQMPTNEVSDIIKRFPESLLERGNRLLEKLRRQDEVRLERMETVLSSADSGSAKRGREVFFHEKAKCATCHRVNQVGGTVGPDLSAIGANRSKQDLLESILFPSASIVRQYESQSILSVDGRVFSGVILKETNEHVVLQRASGEPIEISQQEIEEIQPSAVSVMPEGIEQLLTDQDLVDLVAWLSQLGRTRRGETNSR